MRTPPLITFEVFWRKLNSQKIVVLVNMANLELLSEYSTNDNLTLFDFEVFDSQDLMNVLAYAAVSVGKDRFIYIYL